MSSVTTARLFANQALQLPCGAECVEWATAQLEAGYDGSYRRMLASRHPPYHHFEIVDHRDRAFEELGIRYPGDSAALDLHGAERLRTALEGGEDLAVTLRSLRDTCIARGYRNLYSCCALSFTYEELQASENQFNWRGATRENIQAIIREEAEQLGSTPPTEALLLASANVRRLVLCFVR